VIVHNLENLRDTERHVVTETWKSTRLIVRSDGMGYSVHHTIVPEGSEVHCHYKDHLETNYCIKGAGEVFHVESETVHPIEVGSVYALDKNDKHILRATKGDLHLICVFNPPLSGDETHNEEGGYDAS